MWVLRRERRVPARLVSSLALTYPPLTFTSQTQVATNIEALRERRIPVGEIRVLPQAVVPTYFARCSPLISPQLSAMIQGRMRAGGYIDGAGNILRESCVLMLLFVCDWATASCQQLLLPLPCNLPSPARPTDCLLATPGSSRRHQAARVEPLLDLPGLW